MVGDEFIWCGRWKVMDISGVAGYGYIWSGRWQVMDISLMESEFIF